MKRMLAICLVLGCQSSPAPSPPAAPSAQAVPLPEVRVDPPLSAPEAPSSPLGAPLTGPPRIVVENHSTVDIDIYGAYLVDERGEQGTMELWPHRFDCPKYEPKEHIVPKGGIYEMPAPSRPYDSDKCAPGAKLAPGRYLLRLQSGYGEDLYGFAAFDLPLKEPVRVRIVNHADAPSACDVEKAQRAARLVAASVKALPGLPPDFLDGCDVAKAGCGKLPLEETPPPQMCTITLHEELLRIDRPAGDDALRGVTAWTDREAVYARAPEVNLTSATAVKLGGGTVVLEGLPSHHRHEHGGAAASIGHMAVRVRNPLGRSLSYSVLGVEWMTDHDCGLPRRVVKRPAVRGAAPKKLPPGKSELDISFDAQGAYMAHCDRFASRARLRVEGKPATITVEHEVMRFEPLRREATP